MNERIFFRSIGKRENQFKINSAFYSKRHKTTINSKWKASYGLTTHQWCQKCPETKHTQKKMSEIEPVLVEDADTRLHDAELPVDQDTIGSSQPVTAQDDDTTKSQSLTQKQMDKIREKEERERRKLEEKLARERTKEEERLKRERAKEEEKRSKEDKKIQKELERKKKEEEKERLKKENELKREQLKREKERKRLEEKEERERRKIEEKEEKERRRLEEKNKKEEERQKAEDEKKMREEAEQKKKEKLKISNFFRQKTTLKSTVQPDRVSEDTDDYHKSFQPFFVREGVSLHNAGLPSDSLQRSMDEFDSALKNNNSTPSSSDLPQWFTQHPKLIEEQQHQSAQYIFDNELAGAPILVKFIKFYENVRSWIGTYTKEHIVGIGRDPLQELPPFIDFDDDLGEDEEGDGEDIDDEDDDEEDEEDEEDEMNDFLEEDQAEQQRKKVLGPLIPVVSWGTGQTQGVRIRIIKPEMCCFPLDPMFDYWGKPITVDEPAKKKQKTLITDKEDLEKFALKVHDCDFTVPTMVEILKKELPSYTKATIENTLRALATKVGPKQTEKKWQVDHEALVRMVE